MKPVLASRNRVPYGGSYTWKDPMTGLEVMGTTWNMLVDRAMTQRKANGVPVGLNFEDEIERDICRSYPVECVNLDQRFPRARDLALHDVVVGTRVMVSFMASGRELVSRAEAERRAQICVNCPWNMRFAKPCAGVCAELAQVVQAITGNVGTQYDLNLRSCSICACFLQSAIWIPWEIQYQPLSQEQKEQFNSVDWCWKSEKNQP